MVKKAWESAVGERTGSQEDGDELLAQKKSDRERARIERQEAEDEAAHKARMAKYYKDTATSEAAVEKSGEKREETGGFKVTGGVNLGNLDLQEERNQAKAEAERLRAEVANTANRTAQENNQLREQLHAAEMREIKATNDAAIAMIRDKIDGRSPVEIIADIKSMAAELGMKPPDPGASDPALQVRLLELQHAEAAREREFQWQMQRDREEREDRKEAQKMEAAARAADLAQRAKRDEYFAKAPAAIGQAIGKALIEGGGAETEATITTKGKMPGIEAGIGEFGEAECLKCHQPVAIGPTARTAVCSGCGARYPIKRVNTVPATDRAEAGVMEETEEEE